MRKIEHLNRRLMVARRECEDADRVWRVTMALDAPPADEPGDVLVARRLHAVWQEREAARERVVELQRRLDAATTRRPLIRHWPSRLATRSQESNDVFAGCSRTGKDASNPPA